MSWSHVQDAPGSNGTANSGSASSLSTGAFGSQPATGSYVIVFVSGWSSSATPTVTCTDNAATPNTYTQLILKAGTTSQYSGYAFVALFVATINSLPVSGNLNPKVSLAPTGALTLSASNFSGGSTTTDGSSGNAGNATTPTAGSITTTNAGDLLLAVVSVNDGMSATPPTNYTAAGTDTATNQPGQGCWRIPGTTVTGNDPQWSGNSDNSQWAAAQAALQPPSTAVPTMDWSTPSDRPRFQAEPVRPYRGDGLPPQSFFVDLALLDAGRSAVPLPRFAKGFRSTDPGTQSLLTVYPPVLPLEDGWQRRPRHFFAAADPGADSFVLPAAPPPVPTLPWQTEERRRPVRPFRAADPGSDPLLTAWPPLLPISSETAALRPRRPLPLDPGTPSLALLPFAFAPIQEEAALRLPRWPRFLDPGAQSLVVSPPPPPPPLVLGWETDRGEALTLRRPFRASDDDQGWFIWPLPPQLPLPSPPPIAPPLVSGEAPAPSYPLADAVDDDTEQAILLLWQAAGDIDPETCVDDDTEQAILLLWELSVQFSELFSQLPRTGRQKPTAPGADVGAVGPYAIIDSRLLRTELIAADSLGSYGWNDYRTVTITVYGLRKDVVEGVALILAVFNRRLGAPGKPALSYPSGARFVRWWPVGNAVIEEDKDTKAGKDVWKGTIRAEVWSVRDELSAGPGGATGNFGDTSKEEAAPTGAPGLSDQIGDKD